MAAVTISSGDTAWLLTSTALVMLMTPAVGFFYGGLVRKKNVLATIMHSFFILCLISIQWVLWGYSLAFGPDAFKGIVGNLSWIGLNNVSSYLPNSDYAPTVPHMAYMAFQMMFAVITPALITGAFAERKKFKAFILFSILWATLVYDPVAHWVWSTGGWLHKLGALDFAGGTVVHITSGASALICAMLLGKRYGLGKEKMEAHDITLSVLGAVLLWFGWFGFNAGSALTSGQLATIAFVTTNTAAAMGALTWMTMDWIVNKRPTILGTAAGSVAGLVAITPASGFVTVPSAILIGFLAGLLCFLAVKLKLKTGVDDALDVFAVHGIGGTIGALATGLFATVAINSAGSNGLFYGNPHQLWVQFIAVAAVWIYSSAATFIIFKFVDFVIGTRVPKKAEMLGLDESQHGETAYQL
jgi:ammonium transporter, Amt family